MSQIIRAKTKTPEILQAESEARLRKVEARERKAKEGEAERNILKASWERIKGEPALTELLEYISVRKEMNLQLSMTGVGTEPSEEAAIVRFTNEQRISHLDKAFSLDEISDYIIRRLQEK